MYMGCYTHGVLISSIEHGGMCQGSHWDAVDKPDLRLVLCGFVKLLYKPVLTVL